MKNSGAGRPRVLQSGSGPRSGLGVTGGAGSVEDMAGEYREGPGRKVLFVIHHAVFGGPHNQALRLAGPLRERGYETVVLVPDMAGDAPGRLSAAGVSVERVRLHSLRAKPDPIVQLRFALSFLPEVLAIRRRIRDQGVHLVQVGGLVNPHAALAARLAGVPIVWQLLDTRSPRPLAWAAMLWVRALATVVMPTGRRILPAFPGWRRIAPRIVPFIPPVDTSTFRPIPGLRSTVRVEWGIPADAPVIGSVANLNPQKGISMLIDAFGRVKARLPNARLVIVGAEYEAHAQYARGLRRRLAALGLIEGVDVYFLGARRDVERQLQGFDLFALASVPRSEGMPTVLLEAMSCGLPVVATDVGGVAEAIEHGSTGSVVPPSDVKALADAATRILLDPQSRAAMGAAGRQRALDRFTVERCADAHARAYDLAMASKGHGASSS